MGYAIALGRQAQGGGNEAQLLLSNYLILLPNRVPMLIERRCDVAF